MKCPLVAIKGTPAGDCEILYTVVFSDTLSYCLYLTLNFQLQQQVGHTVPSLLSKIIHLLEAATATKHPSTNPCYMYDLHCTWTIISLDKFSKKFVHPFLI